MSGSGVVGRATLSLYRQIVRTRNKAFSVLAGGAFAEFGSGSVVQLPVRLSGEHRMSIGADVFVGAGAWLQVLDIGDSADDIALQIGDRAAFAGGCVVSVARSLTIGADVAMARNCYVADHTHAYTDSDTSISDQGLTDINPVVIEDGVWLGENVVVLPGVTIGRGSVVGANSVVTQDLPPHTVALGIPARIVRRFGPEDA
jgi:acetyltransferase-like isoleucine patch superfamily enzyme